MAKDIYQLEEIIETMFSNVLGLDIWRNPAAMVLAKGQAHLTASLQLSGDWDGVISISLPLSLAESLAAIMFDIEVPDLGADDIEDAMGELANIAGGSFKSSVTGSVDLGLPVVTSGTNYTMRFPGSIIVAQAGFECEHDCFHASILTKGT